MNKEKTISIVVVLIIVAALAYWIFGMGGGSLTMGSKNVAMVNNVAITQEMYDTQLESAIASFKQQGIDVDNVDNAKLIKEQVLNDLISNELVMQEIAKAGISATAEEVETQYQAVLTQAGGAENLKTELAKVNITDAKFRENISKQISIQKYLLNNVDTSTVVVTEEEIAKFYNENGGTAEGAPTLESVKDQIQQQILANKQQVLIADFVAGLRAKATVEVIVQ